MSERPLIDWWLAEQAAAALAGTGPATRGIAERELRKMGRRSVELVCEYTGLRPGGEMPTAELVGRREWIQLNLESMRFVTEPLERRLAGALPFPGPLGGAARALAGMAVGVELGLATGYLGQRVLGQYDVALVGPPRPPRLLFVAPNLIEARRRIGAKREPFLQWIALHEATHAVQFAAVPWLRDHLAGMVRELVAEAEIQMQAGALARMRGMLTPPDPRRVIAAVRSGDLVSLVAGERQLELIRSIQAAMTVVEGYSEHVMDAVGNELGPGYGEMRRRLEERRADRGMADAIVARLLGLDMKMRQYATGKSFADEVVARAGMGALNEVWTAPAALPRQTELERPDTWLARAA